MKMNLAKLALAVSMTASMPVLAATTATGGQMNYGVEADADGGSSVIGTDSDVAAGLPTTLSVSASATSTGPNGDVSVAATGSSQWFDVNSGTISMYQARDITMVAGIGAAYFNRLDPAWEYDFTAGSNGSFDIDYDLVGAGGTFGIYGWALYINGSYVTLFGAVVDPTMSGTYSYALTGGTDYAVQLLALGNIRGSVLPEYDATLTGDFDWNITADAVPEPASWAMMIGGFGLVGSTLRRRRLVAA
jgi:hypothetical protein